MNVNKYGEKKKYGECILKDNIIYLEEGPCPKEIPIRSDQSFKIIDIMVLREYFNIKTYFISIKEKLYLLFNCGKVIDFETNDYSYIISNLFPELQRKLLNYEENYSKIIIAGHSMGCVFTLKFAEYLQKEYLKQFNNYLFLGSGQYCCLDQNNCILNGSNIYIFITYYTDIDKNNKYYDPYLFLQSNHDTKIRINYYPLIALEIIMIDDTMEQKYNGNFIIINENIPKQRHTSFANNLHKWTTYLNCFNSLI